MGQVGNNSGGCGPNETESKSLRGERFRDYTFFKYKIILKK